MPGQPSWQMRYRINVLSCYGFPDHTEQYLRQRSDTTSGPRWEAAWKAWSHLPCCTQISSASSVYPEPTDKALGDRLYCTFIDHDMLRNGQAETAECKLNPRFTGDSIWILAPDGGMLLAAVSRVCDKPCSTVFLDLFGRAHESDEGTRCKAPCQRLWQHIRQLVAERTTQDVKPLTLTLSQPQTLSPKPYTLNPKPYTLKHAFTSRRELLGRSSGNEVCQAALLHLLLQAKVLPRTLSRPVEQGSLRAHQHGPLCRQCHYSGPCSASDCQDEPGLLSRSDLLCGARSCAGMLTSFCSAISGGNPRLGPLLWGLAAG